MRTGLALSELADSKPAAQLGQRKTRRSKRMARAREQQRARCSPSRSQSISDRVDNERQRARPPAGVPEATARRAPPCRQNLAAEPTAFLTLKGRPQVNISPFALLCVRSV